MIISNNFNSVNGNSTNNSKNSSIENNNKLCQNVRKMRLNEAWIVKMLTAYSKERRIVEAPICSFRANVELFSEAPLKHNGVTIDSKIKCKFVECEKVRTVDNWRKVEITVNENEWKRLKRKGTVFNNCVFVGKFFHKDCLLMSKEKTRQYVVSLAKRYIYANTFCKRSVAESFASEVEQAVLDEKIGYAIGEKYRDKGLYARPILPLNVKVLLKNFEKSNFFTINGDSHFYYEWGKT